MTDYADRPQNDDAAYASGRVFATCAPLALNGLTGLADATPYLAFAHGNDVEDVVSRLAVLATTHSIAVTAQDVVTLDDPCAPEVIRRAERAMRRAGLGPRVGSLYLVTAKPGRRLSLVVEVRHMRPTVIGALDGGSLTSDVTGMLRECDSRSVELRHLDGLSVRVETSGGEYVAVLGLVRYADEMVARVVAYPPEDARRDLVHLSGVYERTSLAVDVTRIELLSDPPYRVGVAGHRDGHEVRRTS